ncbi:MAG: glyoxalase [Bacteroidetes bacterium]|jgi:catechol 2,3-dioxygenase-like lactoylglutathione lyase family enzyme|nr:glyoxalase [Bacteroidota bacterium]
MKIKELTLYTSELHQQRDFYQHVFGLKTTNKSPNSFSVRLGHSKLLFEKSEKPHVYHYCFLIPNNKLALAINWLQDRLSVITYENGRIIEPGPDDWNSESVYFFDPTVNILEFIVRHNLNNYSDREGFDASQIISMNEIGMASKHPERLNQELKLVLGSKLKYGNVDRFGANGSEDGLFLLVNYNKKRTWFPTNIPPTPTPFKGIFEHDNNQVLLKFENESVIAIA